MNDTVHKLRAANGSFRAGGENARIERFGGPKTDDIDIRQQEGQRIGTQIGYGRPGDGQQVSQYRDLVCDICAYAGKCPATKRKPKAWGSRQICRCVIDRYSSSTAFIKVCWRCGKAHGAK